METGSSTPQEKKTASFPPRRGQIKAKIFESLVKAVTNMTSKPEAQGKNRGEGSGGGGSASTTSPPSAYSSDANSDICETSEGKMGSSAHRWSPPVRAPNRDPTYLWSYGVLISSFCFVVRVESSLSMFLRFRFLETIHGSCVKLLCSCTTHIFDSFAGS